MLSSASRILRKSRWAAARGCSKSLSCRRAMSSQPGEVAHTVVLVRHGQSQWNLENRFTGWVDVPLTEQGEKEARDAGKMLKREGFTFDVAYTSMLKRAIKTCWLALEEMDLFWLPQKRSWRLNERHYGALAGLNKAETVKKVNLDWEGGRHGVLADATGWRAVQVRSIFLRTDTPPISTARRGAGHGVASLVRHSAAACGEGL